MKKHLIFLLLLSTPFFFVRAQDTQTRTADTMSSILGDNPAPTKTPAPPAVGVRAVGNPATGEAPNAVGGTARQTFNLSNAPSLQSPTQGTIPANVETPTSRPEAMPDIRSLPATLLETSYPEVVRRNAGNGGYSAANVPAGWKLVPLRQLKFDPAPSINLANGEVYEVQSAPFVLLPASNAMRVPINPRALQVLNNFMNAEIDLMRQAREALRLDRSTQVE